MCGIIGYKGNKDGNEVVLKGLHSLEYRGYDSWGIASVHENEIKIIKKVGQIGHIKLKDLGFPKSNLALGHTRWATHGGVSEINAHPHLSKNKKIVVVHNGIVENFQELRRFLEEQGFEFISETDSEIFPHLIEYFMEQKINFEGAVRRTLNKIEGSFAIVAINLESKEMVGARHGSPLVAGIGNGEFFLASDVPPFLAYTKKAVYLDDGELTIINKHIKFINIETGKEIKKQHQTIEWDVEQAKKGKYPHFMLKEINEQKDTIKLAAEQPPELIKKVTKMIEDARGVFFVGCGTSYHACVSAAYVFAKISKIHVNVVIASEFSEYEDFLTDKTLVVALSQSGETADLLEAIRTAKKHNCKTFSVVNVVGSSLTRLCDRNIMMNAGPEICVLSTKSYTSQLTILLLLAYSVAGKLGKAKELIDTVSKSVGEIIDTNLKKLKQLATKIKDATDFFLIGRGLAFPSALEGALKIKEISYIHAEGFAGAELKHGTIALIEDGVPVFVLSTPATRHLILSNAMEIKSRGGYIIGIDSEDNDVFDYFIKVPDVGNAEPILWIIPIQIFSYYIALARGCDPDKPRNLAKSVTVK